MKKLFNRSLVILVILAAVSGCEFNSVEAPESGTINGVVSIEAMAQELGRQHNAGLDHVLQQMKIREEPFENRREALAFFRESVEEFIQINSDAGPDRIAEYFDMDRVFTKSEKQRLATTDRFANSSLKLSPELRSRIEAMFAVFQQQTEEEGFFEQDYAPALNNATRNLVDSFSREEQLVILGVKEILTASVDYWKKNRSEWISEIARLHKGIAPEDATALQNELAVATPCAAYPGLPLCHAIDWSKVAQEDGGGLILGSIEVVILWIATGPPGWAVGILMVAGGAAGSSTVEIYNQIVELM